MDHEMEVVGADIESVKFPPLHPADFHDRIGDAPTLRAIQRNGGFSHGKQFSLHLRLIGLDCMCSARVRVAPERTTRVPVEARTVRAKRDVVMHWLPSLTVGSG
jgi:hypothetical protein